MPTLKVYQSDAEDYFAGVTYADENPVRPGEYIMPGGAYIDEPDLSLLQPNEVYKRADDKLTWIIVPDFRGVRYWLPDGSSSIITQRGVPIPEGASLTLVERPLTSQEEREVFEAYVQAYIDTPARAWGYDSTLSAISYIGDSHAQFNADGLALRSFRSSCWVAANAVYRDVLTGSIPKPTQDELILMLPAAPSQPVVSPT